MIIGISGVAGSGKDTIADYIVNSKNACKISLSDPIKRFVSKVFNWGPDILWGPSEKRNTIDYKCNSIEFWEKANSKFDLEAIGWIHEIGLNYNPEQHIFNLNKWFKNLMIQCLNNNIQLTPRYVLQSLGTEYGRGEDEYVWINYAINISNLILKGCTYSKELGIDSYFNLSNYNFIVIADCRFKNELEALKDSFLIRVLRKKSGLKDSFKNHLSEKEQFGISDSEFNVIINNDGSLEELYRNVDNALLQLNMHLNA